MLAQSARLRASFTTLTTLTTILFGLLLLTAPAAQAAGLNDTGQTLCYDSAGATISCTVAPAADDGRYGRDAAATAGVLTKIGAGIAGFDFTKIANNGSVLAASAALGTGSTGWACTRDNVSGLTWEVKTTVATDLRYSGHSYTWYNTNGAENGGNAGSVGVVNTCRSTLPLNQCNTQAFAAAVNNVALCGYTDWRLPTPRELRSIKNYGAGNSIDTTYFPNTVLSTFWSASTHVGDGGDVPGPGDAWVVSFGVELDGGGGGHGHSKMENGDTRLVRDGLQSAPSLGACTAGNPNANVVGSTPSADFTNNGNGTVTHTKTGLMWKQCAEGLSGAGCATGATTTVTWSNALAAAKSSSFAGFTDWRMPNLKELHSIVETCGYNPAINQSIFPAVPALGFGSVFWSASSSISAPVNAWIFVFGDGGSVADTKTSLMNTRLVRGGQSFDSFDLQADSRPTFTITGTPSGGNSNLSLLANFTIAPADVDRPGSFYIAAQLTTGQLFFLTPSGFTLHSGGPLPTFSTGILSNQSITVLSGVNVTPYPGVRIFAGYGLNEADLIGNSKYSLIYTVQ